MKKIKHSSLFFYLLITLSFFSNTSTIFAQKSVDSLRHYYNLSTNPKKSTDLIAAYNFYKNQKKKSLANKDTLNTIQNLRFIASILKSLGDLYESEASAIEALKLLDNLTNDKTIIEAKLGLYNHLGILNYLFKDYDKSLKLYDSALEIAEKKSDSITIFNNKGNIYLDAEKFELALNAYSAAYTSSINSKNKILIARALDNLGFAQSKLNLPESLPNMLKALEIRKSENYTKGIYTSYNHLTKYYSTKKNEQEAIRYANKGYEIAKSTGNPVYIEDALSTLLDLSKDPKVIEYKYLKDSIAKAKQLSKNIYSYNKYNYDVQEKKFLQSKLKREKDKATYISITAFILILSTFLYFILTIKHKNDKLKEIYSTETRISKKVHDELANDVYHVMNKIQNKLNTPQDDIIDQLDSIYQRTRNISYENGAIDLDDNYYYIELKDMIGSYQDNKTTIMTHGLNKAIWSRVSDIKKIVTERVLKELMTNMKKHSKAKNVMVSFIKDKQNITITYTDDGVGIKKTDRFKSNGLQNVENRIKNINGNFIFDMNKEKGLGITITFPI